MKRKIVVLLLAVAVACAGTLPLASTAHAANLDNNIINKNLTPLANQMIVNIPKAISSATIPNTRAMARLGSRVAPWIADMITIPKAMLSK